LPFTSAVVLGLTLMALSCSSSTDCDSSSTCAPSGGSAGTGGSGGVSPSGGQGGTTTAGSSSGGTSAGAAGAADEAGAAGAAGAAPCDGKCTGTTPVCNATTNACVECVDKSQCADPKPSCDATTNTCVECTGNTDCPNAAAPLCDPTREQCVACLQQSDCKDATASMCNAGACMPCSVDADCSGISGKGVCNAGTCVECSPTKEAACSGKSCDPKLLSCTMTSVGTVDSCQPCVADSECIGGNQADPDARCVPMMFMGVARPGGFCLRRFAKTCSAPYFKTPTDLASLSGAAAEAYCGIDQDSTRCEAVLDLVNSAACPDGKDTSCGCSRGSSGACTSDGAGGLCKTVLGSANICTIPCAVAAQCKAPLTCGGVSYCH
jgi:hypothetical protein